MTFMKALAIAGIATAPFVPAVASACDADFTLLNRAPLPIVHLYVSPSDRNRWYTDNDFLGADTVDSMASYHVNVNSSWTYNGTFDIRADFDGGLRRTLYRVPLCSRDEIVIDRFGNLTAQ